MKTSGVSIAISNSSGHQGCEGHNVHINTRSTFSFLILARHRRIKAKGRKAYARRLYQFREKAFTAVTFGCGIQLTNFGNWRFQADANNSTSVGQIRCRALTCPAITSSRSHRASNATPCLQWNLKLPVNEKLK